MMTESVYEALEDGFGLVLRLGLGLELGLGLGLFFLTPFLD